MNRTILTAAGVLSASSLLLVDSAVKGAVLLILAGVAAMILRRDSAATRHLVWLLAIVAILVVPVLSVMLPQWRVLPRWAAISPEPAVVETSQLAIAAPETIASAMAEPETSRPPDGVAGVPRSVQSVEIESPFTTAQEPSALIPEPPASPAESVAPQAAPESAGWNWNWLNALPSVWAIGFGVLILRLVAARWVLWKTERQGTITWSTTHPGEAENDPLATALAAACLQLGIRRPIALLIHPERIIPVVWGVLRYRLLLPVAAREWSDEQLRSVLLHELAHLKRLDTLAQLLAQIACALHWFNPLVWFAAWRLSVERERACDDLVLASGVRPSVYAGHLLDVVTGLSPARWTQSCGLTMARKSSLESRLVAVLSGKLNRRGVSVAAASIALAIAIGIAVPIAMLRAANHQRNPPKLRVLRTDGSPAQFNGVVEAAVGFGAAKPLMWLDFAAKDGLVPLDKLPDGTHWLVAASDSEERTAFQVTLPVPVPVPEAPIERRLRLSSGWVSKAIEIDPSVDRTDPAGEIIVVELHNASGAEITVTEDDFSLTMFPGHHRVLAPRPNEAAPRGTTPLTIADGKSGKIRLSWRRWIHQGLWAARTMEDIDEPWSLESQAGRMQLRVYLGNLGAVPVFVTDPRAITEPAAAGESLSELPQAEFQAEAAIDQAQSPAGKEVRRELEAHLAIDQASLPSRTAELEKRLAERAALVKRGGDTAQLDWQIAMDRVRVAILQLKIAEAGNGVKPGSTADEALQSLKRETLVRWGEPVDGVQIGLERVSLADEFSPGQPVEFRHRVRNTAAEARSLTLRFGSKDNLKMLLYSGNRFTANRTGRPVESFTVDLPPGGDQAIAGSEFQIETRGMLPDRYHIESYTRFVLNDEQIGSKQIVATPPGWTRMPSDIPLTFDVVAQDPPAADVAAEPFVLQGGPEITWGQPVQGLQGGLRYTRPLKQPAQFNHRSNWEWELGDTVQAEFVVRNVLPTPTSVTFAVAEDDQLVELDPHAHSVSVYDGYGPVQPRRSKSGVAYADGHAPTSRERTRMLKPGETIVVARLDFQLLQRPKEVADYRNLPRLNAILVEPAGLYSLGTRFQVRGSIAAPLSLPTGKARLWIHDPNAKPEDSATESLESAVDEGQITLRYDMPGAAPQADIVVQSLGKTGRIVTRSIPNGSTTDAIELPAGRYEVFRRMMLKVGGWQGTVPCNRQVVQVAAGKVAKVEFVRPRDNLITPKGLWTQLASQAVPGAFLTVHPIADNAMNSGDPDYGVDYEADRETVAATTCGPDGRFELEPLPPGRYLVILRALRETDSKEATGIAMPYLVGAEAFQLYARVPDASFFPRDFRIHQRWNVPQWVPTRVDAAAAVTRDRAVSEVAEKHSLRERGMREAVSDLQKNQLWILNEVRARVGSSGQSSSLQFTLARELHIPADDGNSLYTDVPHPSIFDQDAYAFVMPLAIIRGYNDVMWAEIDRRFGAGTRQRIESLAAEPRVVEELPWQQELNRRNRQILVPRDPETSVERERAVQVQLESAFSGAAVRGKSRDRTEKGVCLTDIAN